MTEVGAEESRAASARPPSRVPAWRRAVRPLLTLAILALLVMFARGVDWGATWRALRGASPGLLAAATVVNLLSVALKGVRWWVFLRAIGSPSLWLAIRATFAGAGLNNVLVAQGGEAARVVFVARSAALPSARVLATLVLERLFELVGYVGMLALGIALLELPETVSRAKPLAYAAAAAAAGLLVYLVRARGSGGDVTDQGSAGVGVVAGSAAGEEPMLRPGLGARFRAYLRSFAGTAADISTGPRFAWALLISAGVWALQVWTYHLTAQSAGFPITVVGTLAALLAVNIGFALRATPGNVGVFQLMYAAVAVALGLDREQAIAVAFLIQTQQVIPVTALGIAAAPEFVFRRGR